MFWRPNTALLSIAALALSGCKSLPPSPPDRYSQFIGLTDFAAFTSTPNSVGETVLVSPEIKASMAWRELVVSWNARAPAGSYLNVEARATDAARSTKFYNLGRWSPDDQAFPRTSVSGQEDADARVEVDTLVLSQPAKAVQLRLTLGGANGALPALKFIGLSFCNPSVVTKVLPPNRAAWGKSIPVVERSQQSYAGGNGWCSPTSLSMALTYWAAYPIARIGI